MEEVKKPKVITFATLKGGTGKTNTAFNIIGFLAKKRKKILVIDCDPQANMSNNLNVNQFTEDYDYLGDILEKNIFPNHVIIEKPLSIMPNVDIIPSHINLTSVERRIVSKHMNHEILKRWFEEHASTFKKYDYIICDTSPSLSIPNINAFVISDSIILVADIDINALLGANLFINEWTTICRDIRIENNIAGLLINRYDKRIKISKDFVEYASKNPILKELSFETFIPDNVRLKETSVLKSPISYCDTKNTAYITAYTAYAQLIKELKESEVI